MQGARDIIAEIVNEDEKISSAMRKLFEETGRMESKLLTGKETEAAKFKDYFDFSEKISTIPSHRILAILRGFMEGFLRMEISPVEEEALALMEAPYIKSNGESAVEIRKSIKDSWRRLLQPAMESEFRMALKTKADEEAITVFAENLRQLLLSSPLGSKRILAIDPGYRTGCKVVCLDEQGSFLKSDLIFVHENGRVAEAENKIRFLVEKYRIEAFAIGDGTAGRETDQFIKNLKLGLPVFLVNEDGASVYSASETAREEFPDQDITVRGSISIGQKIDGSTGRTGKNRSEKYWCGTVPARCKSVPVKRKTGSNRGELCECRRRESEYCRKTIAELCERNRGSAGRKYY